MQLPLDSTIDVYLARIPSPSLTGRVLCEARHQEIEATRHPAAKAQKYYVWRLLETAIQTSLGVPVDQLHFEKQANGRWVVTNAPMPICFSLSHCEDAVAVALSHTPVGVDIEHSDRVLTPALADKVLTSNEREIYHSLANEAREDYLLRAWVGKESRYKCCGQGSFCPREIVLDPTKTIVQTALLGEYNIIIAVTAEQLQNVRLKTEW